VVPRAPDAVLPEDLVAVLEGLGLTSGHRSPPAVALTGGVSSEIYRVELPGGPVCVKRALPRLRVAARWEAPVERSRYERRWLEAAGAIVAGFVPVVLGGDDVAGVLVTAWMDPDDHPVWKSELLAGRVDPAAAGLLGDRLGRVHAATADDTAVADRFATSALFETLRLEPYLDATAAVHPDLGPRLRELRARTAGTRRVLVHGDVSPKNVLVGPGGPVLLDAECATFGDPAFDLAFVANHLLLKCVARPPWTAGFVACLDVLVAAYLAHVGWEPAAVLEARAAALLPALALARVDGMSPVEYLDEPGRVLVRRTASVLLGGPPPETLEAVRTVWCRALEAVGR